MQHFAENEILLHLQKGISRGEKYPKSVRLFCLKLHFYSPRAYQFVRNEFENCLPHASTIKSWYRNSDIDSQPGISQNSLSILEKKAIELKQNNQKLVCSLTFDEMSIRKHCQWCSKTKRFLGNVTYGDNLEKIANNAIVFLVNGINAKIQVAVAFEFITTINACQRKNLLLEILAQLCAHDIIISNITFDGLPANIRMCEQLGACFKEDALKTYFIDPCSQRKIHIILDPSHCIKLIRNNLYSRKTFRDAAGGSIEWNYFAKLVEFGNKNNFNLTHKINNRHINFQNRKMHVRIAVQTLSNSVANSLEFLLNRKVAGFTNAGATINFIQIFNKVFDVMNTQKVNHAEPNQFKSAINFFNESEVIGFLNDAKKYIMGLTVKGLKSHKSVSILKSRVKTGFLGFVINIESVINMYHENVEENQFMHMIATYKLSQDHLEMFFSKIRSIHKCNDNPTIQQFIASYKKIQMISDIQISQDANISNILTISSTHRGVSDDDVDLIDRQSSVENQIDIHENYNDYNNTAITFVAHEIERRLLKAGVDGCQLCKKILAENDKIDEQFCVGDDTPCRSTFEICRATDVSIKKSIHDAGPNFNRQVIASVIPMIRTDELYSQWFGPEHDSQHKQFLIRFIINEYIHIKCTYLSRQKTMNMHKKYFRHKYRKDIHRAGQ